jgi:sugar lactone lactonase YvrE
VPLYHVDTPTAEIDVYYFYGVEGTIDQRRRLVELPDRRPDGLAVDVEGGIWVALFGAGEVRRYTPDGHVDEVVEVPTPAVTSCAFGGPDLGELYITTGRAGTDDDHAGAVLRCVPGVVGQPTVPFGG